MPERRWDERESASLRDGGFLLPGAVGKGTTRRIESDNTVSLCAGVCNENARQISALQATNNCVHESLELDADSETNRHGDTETSGDPGVDRWRFWRGLGHAGEKLKARCRGRPGNHATLNERPISAMLPSSPGDRASPGLPRSGGPFPEVQPLSAVEADLRGHCEDCRVSPPRTIFSTSFFANSPPHRTLFKGHHCILLLSRQPIHRWDPDGTRL